MGDCFWIENDFVQCTLKSILLLRPTMARDHRKRHPSVARYVEHNIKASFYIPYYLIPYSILFNSLFYFHNLVWEFKIFTRCSWKWETQRVNTCLKLAMISLESSMSLNIPSNLLVKALPHSKKKSKNHYPFFKNIVLNFTKFDALWLSLWCSSLFSFIELGAHRQIVNTDGAL